MISLQSWLTVAVCVCVSGVWSSRNVEKLIHFGLPAKSRGPDQPETVPSPSLYYSSQAPSKRQCVCVCG
uniref:Putative secreted protein n=1 Tax=Anopheles marajoara TaxID=58244 RepID=A0A2M4CF10_9DIPT